MATVGRYVVRLDVELGDPEQLADNAIAFARAAALAGRPAEAVRLLSRAEAMREELASELAGWVREDITIADGIARARLTPDDYEALWGEGRKMTLEDAVAQAVAV